MHVTGEHQTVNEEFPLRKSAESLSAARFPCQKCQVAAPGGHGSAIEVLNRATQAIDLQDAAFAGFDIQLIHSASDNQFDWRVERDRKGRVG